jgi:type IV secretory pathway VirB4 component
MYLGGLPRSFEGFEEGLKRVGGPHADELRRALYPYTEGKFARLFEANARLAMAEGCHVICYDFKGLLGEHRDLAALALRLAIYEVRRWSARVSRRGHRTFLTLDESWALLDGSTSGTSVASAAGPFLASSIRMGRKEGMSVLSLSQVLEDFSGSAFGAAILGNSSTRFVGHPGAEGVESLRRQLGLSDRQVEQVLRLRRTPEFHEFLLLRGERSDVIRVPGDPFSRWVFSTSPKERERIATLTAAHPDLSLFERMKLLAAEG